MDNFVEKIILALYKNRKMEGIKFLTNDRNERIAVQINLKQLERFQGKIEDILDAIVADSRKNDKEISWEEVKKQLKSDGRIS